MYIYVCVAIKWVSLVFTYAGYIGMPLEYNEYNNTGNGTMMGMNSDYHDDDDKIYHDVN